MPKLFIHVGPSKTGTSGVQLALREHDGSIVTYPKVGLWADGSHHNLVFNFFKDYRRGEVTRSDITQLFAQIGEESGNANRDLIISSEVLASRRTDLFIEALLPYTRFTAKDVSIIFVCREHFARAASLYNQSVKDAFVREQRTPSEFLTLNAQKLCYDRSLRRLLDFGYGVHVMNYHPASTFVPRFLSYIGFDAAVSVPNRYSNASLSVKGMISLLAANRISSDPLQRRRLGLGLSKMSGRFQPPGFIFDQEAAAVAAPFFELDRQALRLRWRLDLPSVNVEEQACSFCLTEADLEELSRVCLNMGNDGDAILKEARAFLPYPRL